MGFKRSQWRDIDKACGHTQKKIQKSEVRSSWPKENEEVGKEKEVGYWAALRVSIASNFNYFS